MEMLTETQNILRKYLDSLTFVSNGITNYEILTPSDFQFELKKISLRYTLPMEPNLENTYKYYKIIKSKAFLQDELLVISFEIPIVNMETYNLYEIFPLPTPHKTESKFLSYIEPSKPYILISKAGTVYSMLNNLQDCQEYEEDQFICQEITISRRIDHPQCEVQLFTSQAKTIPKDCQIRTVIAETEIWHPLRHNQWLFVLTEPMIISILCYQKETKEETISSVGILQLDKNCKAYTNYAILEAQANLVTHNLTNKIPLTDITEDDCCIKLRSNITEDIKLEPIKLSNLDLNELKYAQHKLQQYDEILQQRLKEPFIIKHSKWYTSVLMIILGIILLCIIYNLMKWCGIISLLKRLLCCIKETPESERRLKSLCGPCVQIFNQCAERNPAPRSEYVVSYHRDAEHHYPSCPSLEEPPRYSSRTLPEIPRRTRSSTSSNSSERRLLRKKGVLFE